MQSRTAATHHLDPASCIHPPICSPSSAFRLPPSAFYLPPSTFCLPSLSIHTANSAMSAGVTPLIRLAWPRFAGATRASFCRASVRSPPMEVVDPSRDVLALQPPRTLDAVLLPPDVALVAQVRLDLLPDDRKIRLTSAGSAASHSRAGAANHPGAGRRAAPPWSRRARPQAASFSGARPTSRRRSSRAPAPAAVSRTSALSARRSRRCSARLVNIRYGSLVPFVTRSSISTPMYASARPQDERLRALHLPRGVDPGDDPLGGGFLVAGRAVDLAGEEQAFHRLGLQRAAAAASAGNNRTPPRTRAG